MAQGKAALPSGALGESQADVPECLQMHNIHTLSRLPALLSSQEAACNLETFGASCAQRSKNCTAKGGAASNSRSDEKSTEANQRQVNRSPPFVNYIIWQKLGHFERGEETYPTIKTTRGKLPQNSCPKNIEILQSTRGNVLYE